MTIRKALPLALLLSLVGGCAAWNAAPVLPSRTSMVLDQLVIFSDTPLPGHHRLLEELRTQRTHVSTKLGLPISDEPIHVYLFPTAEKLEAYTRTHFPVLTRRRAYFVEGDTRLNVYAYWGDRVAEDLRHEVAHGYLHAVVPNLPLWLDEGLAEYFEVPRGQDGVNRSHVELLVGAQAGNWRPDLARLEPLRETTDMTQIEYAESWAWVHLMLETSPERLHILRSYLQALVKGQKPASLADELARSDPRIGEKLVDHVTVLRQSLR